MTLPKLRFSWTAARIDGARWRLGLFCLYDAHAKSAGRIRAWRLLISLRGLFAWLSLLVVAGYFSGAGALLWWLHKQPHNTVTYADLVWPPNWARFQQKRGHAMIAEGLDDFNDHKWAEGGMSLRVGLERSPNEPEARLQLAGFYVAINQRPLAKKILTDELAYGYPGADYVKRMCALAADSEDYEWWLATCDTVLNQLAGKPGLVDERNTILLQKMTALMAAGREEEVIRLVDAQGEGHSEMFDEFKVLALLKAGRSSDAVAFLEAWRKRGGVNLRALRLQVRAFREAGKLSDMDHALAELHALTPTRPLPYSYGVVQNLLAGRRTEANQGGEDFLRRFGSSRSVLFVLAEALAEIDEQPMLERLVSYARQQGFALEPFERALVRVFIDKGDWSQARELIAEIRSADQALQPELEFWYGLMECLCNAAIDPSDGTQSSLINFVRNRRLPLKLDRQLIERMRHAGRLETADDLITFAQGSYPENISLKTSRDEVDKELAALHPLRQPSVLPKAQVAVSTPQPLPEPPREVLREDIFFSRLAELKKTGDFSAALKQIQDLRQAQPDWLSMREDEIETEEIRLNGRLGDMAALHLAAGFYLNGDAKHSLKAAALARELYEAGCKEEAILLAKDILRKIPDYPPAKRMLAEWERKPAPAKP
ncbi:MAG TPA: hypothetical protein VL357_07310 [Rariglobus sp.]|jgi:hypothetical protein|nr:hypothetical protein [Rariglobus sp.]